MIRIWLVGAVFTIVACKKPDCEQYATHLADVATSGLQGDDLKSRRGTVEFSARESCKDGSVKPSEVSCVIAASTMSEILHCQGLGDTVAKTPDVPKPEPAGTVVHRKGFSARMPVGWREAPKTKDTEVLLRGEDVNGVMILRIEGKPLGLDSDAACRAAADRFSASNGTTLEVAAVSNDRLGKSCHTIHHDDRIKIDANTYAASDHDSLIVNCFYPKTATTPPAFCSDVLASVTVDRP